MIFDTNMVRNADLFNFLGGRTLLKDLDPDANFFLPELVCEEIKNQKRKRFEDLRSKLLSNPLVKKLQPDLSVVEELDIDDLISKIHDEESFDFETFSCVQGELIDEYRAMALRNQAPFDKDSDKGIKDACIYFSILRFVADKDLKKVFFACKDGRLRTAFEDHPIVIPISSVEEFHNLSAASLVDEYFAETVSEVLEVKVLPEQFVSSWKNWEGLWVLQIEAEESFLIAEESRQVIEQAPFEDIDLLVTSLTESSNFANTHAAVANLTPYIFALSEEHVARIKVAAEKNTQIGWLAEDSDVETFLQRLNLT